MKLLHKANEKARKMKKTFCFNICSCHFLWQNVSMSGLRISKLPRTKKGNLGEHFSASAYGLGFKNFSLGSLLSTSVTWKNLKSDVDKFFLRRGKNNYRNKILFQKDEAEICDLAFESDFTQCAYSIPYGYLILDSACTALMRSW